MQRTRSSHELNFRRWLRKEATQWAGRVKRRRTPRYQARRTPGAGLYVRFQQVARIRPRHLGPRTKGLQRAAAREVQAWLSDTPM